MRIQNILLATDLSRAARQAYDPAIDLAKAWGAQITLIHVNEAAAFGFNTSRELVTYLGAVGERISSQLAEEVDLLTRRGVSVVTVEAAGTPSQEILKAAEEHDVDLVVLARRGSSSARHIHFGSTAKKVVRHVDRPLLVVPGEEETPASFEGIHSILTTTDFSQDSTRGLRVSLELADHFSAKVTVVHVLRLPNPLPAVPGEPPLYFPRESLEELQAFHEQELAKLIEEVGSSYLDHLVTINSDAADGIIETARELGSQLIIVPSHGKGAIRAVLFGSTSERILKGADRPVLVLPRDWLERDAKP